SPAAAASAIAPKSSGPGSGCSKIRRANLPKPAAQLSPALAIHRDKRPRRQAGNLLLINAHLPGRFEGLSALQAEANEFSNFVGDRFVEPVGTLRGENRLAPERSAVLDPLSEGQGNPVRIAVSPHLIHQKQFASGHGGRNVVTPPAKPFESGRPLPREHRS